MIVLNVSDDGRVLSAAIYAKPPTGALMIDESELPTGSITDYLYVDGAFVYDPLPTQEESTQEEPTQEERISALEEALDMILSGVTE